MYNEANPEEERKQKGNEVEVQMCAKIMIIRSRERRSC